MMLYVSELAALCSAMNRLVSEGCYINKLDFLLQQEVYIAMLNSGCVKYRNQPITALVLWL